MLRNERDETKTLSNFQGLVPHVTEAFTEGAL